MCSAYAVLPDLKNLGALALDVTDSVGNLNKSGLKG